MITIIKNVNLPQWFQVTFTDALGFFDIVAEVQGKSKAMRIAKKLAKKEKVDHVNVDGFIMPTGELQVEIVFVVAIVILTYRITT